MLIGGVRVHSAGWLAVILAFPLVETGQDYAIFDFYGHIGSCHSFAGLG